MLPEEGRVGVAKAGPFAGQYLLFALEYDQLCVVYTASPTGDQSQNTELRVDLAGVPALIGEWQVEWLLGEEEIRIERSLFGVRDHWRNVQRGGPRSSFWSRLTRN